MNKLDLIATLKHEAELTKSEAAAVVHLFFNEIANALAEGDQVEIRGLCSFYVKKFCSFNECYDRDNFLKSHILKELSSMNEKISEILDGFKISDGIYKRELIDSGHYKYKQKMSRNSEHLSSVYNSNIRLRLE